MHLGTLVAAGLCGAFGLVAGRASAPAAPMVLAPNVLPAPVVVVAPTPVVAAPVAAEDSDEANDGGVDLAEVFVQLQAKDVQRHSAHLAIRGAVTDQTGQALVGVTVIVTSPNLEGTQTALTNEAGEYNVENLPAGYYCVTYYYADFTAIRNDIASREIEATIVDEKIDTTPVERHYNYESYDSAPYVYPESTTQGITIDADYTYNGPAYTRNIPVGRTFEAVLGAAAGSQEDSLGVSFTGTTSLGNQYIVEGDDE